MKIKLDIDCTPEEARRFMGLPDVTALHEAWLKKAQAAIADGDIGDMMAIWSQMGLRGLEQWQAFLHQANDKKS